MDGDVELNETLYDLATLIAAYSNPYMFFDLKKMTEEEIDQELNSLKNLMMEMLG